MAQLAKTKMLALWPLTENVCGPLSKTVTAIVYVRDNRYGGEEVRRGTSCAES